jgi:hypothetical protein
MAGERLPLLLIGKSEKPHCFRYVHSLPTRSQQSAWIKLYF